MDKLCHKIDPFGPLSGTHAQLAAGLVDLAVFGSCVDAVHDDPISFLGKSSLQNSRVSVHSNLQHITSEQTVQLGDTFALETV